MTNTEFFDDPISVTCSIDNQGHTTLQSLSWQGRQHTIVATGRQWEAEDGRHLMAEAADGTRFELQLQRQNLIWHVRRVWRAQMAA